MNLNADTFENASSSLHRFLETSFWDGHTLGGPDIGVRWNSRVGRFVKSYLSFWPWKDHMVYQQTQGYWILANWTAFDLTQDEHYRALAIAAADQILRTQRPEGYWEYPNPEWKNRIATVEGDFAILGMLETFQRTQDQALLEASQRWYRYLIDKVDFQGSNGMLAVNYFANFPRGMIPNNSTLTLWALAKLAQAAGDSTYLDETGPQMVKWLAYVQLPSGELPYMVMNYHPHEKDRIHFLCYQYNAFQCLDLIEYHDITGDAAMRPVIEKLAAYLANGVTPSGASAYDCYHPTPEVNYYTAALAAALSLATARGFGDYRAEADRAFSRVLSLQKPDGNFQFFSRANYGFLQDRRAYPRSLSMVLYHLRLETSLRRDASAATPANDETAAAPDPAPNHTIEPASPGGAHS